MEIFKVREVKRGENPPVEGLDLLKLQIEAPMRWSESYEMYGERRKVLFSQDLSEYSNYQLYKAKCKLCECFTEAYYDSNEAIQAHFMHCARDHGYIFPESSILEVEDETLQQIIVASQVYDLPLPEFEDHDNCIKQHLKDKIVCAVHEGNEKQ